METTTAGAGNEPNALNAVMAHAMLGTVAAAKGAVDLVLMQDLDVDEARSLLLMASRRLQFLTDQIRDLAFGLPDEAVAFLAELRRDETAAPTD